MRYRDRNKTIPSSDTAHVSGAKLTIGWDLHGVGITPRFTLMLSISSNYRPVGYFTFSIQRTRLLFYSSAESEAKETLKPLLSLKIPDNPFQLDYHTSCSYTKHTYIEFFRVHSSTPNHCVFRPTIMLFKLIIPLTLITAFIASATPVFHFPDVVHRAEIPVGITVHEYNATAAAHGAAAPPKLETRGSLEERGNCYGSIGCFWRVGGNDCRAASNVRYGNETQKETHIPKENLFSLLRGVHVDWLTLFSLIRFAVF